MSSSVDTGACTGVESRSYLAWQGRHGRISQQQQRLVLVLVLKPMLMLVLVRLLVVLVVLALRLTVQLSPSVLFPHGSLAGRRFNVQKPHKPQNHHVVISMSSSRC